jgi:uncharacterized membrane protein SpoIIM required for sporulation
MYHDSMQTVEQFIAARQAGWERLETLARRARGGQITALTPDELEDLGRLYRQATADLAQARRDYAGDRLLIYLNRLVAETYPVIYQPGGWNAARVRAFYTETFPRLVRKQAPYVAIAAALFLVPAVLGFLAVVAQPETAAVLLPQATYERIRGFLENRQLWTQIPPAERPYMSGAIMTNNIQVAFLAFGGGLLLGVGAVLVLLLNGLLLGGIAGLVQTYGLSLDLWSFILPHGIIELSVIFMAGGAGLRLADALVRPGLLSRAESLRQAGREAVQMVLGGASLRVIAGLIEGFISPSDLPPWVRIPFGLLMGILLYLYLIFAGRTRRARRVRP